VSSRPDNYKPKEQDNRNVIILLSKEVTFVGKNIINTATSYTTIHWAQYQLNQLIINMSFVILHNIECIQMNAMHCKDAAALLSQSVYYVESFAAMLQEPFYDGKGNIFGYEDFQVFQGSPKPRAGIILPRSQNAMLVNEFSDRDIATICIKLKGQLTYITSIYMPRKGKKFIINPKIPKMFKKCKELGNGIIICADTNVHTPIMGGVSVPDKPGTLLEELLLAFNLVSHNTGTTPTFHINKRKSFIDITARYKPGTLVRRFIIMWLL
jgi:hypothetical protein